MMRTDDGAIDQLISTRLKEELGGLGVRDEWASEVVNLIIGEGAERISEVDGGQGVQVARTMNWLFRFRRVLNAELEIPLPVIVTASTAVVATALIIATSLQITAVRPSVSMWRVVESHHGAVTVQEVAVKL